MSETSVILYAHMNWTLSAFADEAGASSDQQINALLTAGLRLIDIRSVDGHNITELPLDQAKTIKSKLDDHGIQTQMFGSPIGKIDVTDDVQSDLDKLKHLGELAPVFGCNAVRMFSYYNKTELSHDTWREQTLERLSRLRDEAERQHLVLYHENERHIFGDLTADVLTLAPLRGANFKLIFDFDNYQQSGEDVWQSWLQLRDLTDAIHLKDSTPDNRHVPVGQGNGQVEKILRDAVKTGWSGPLTIEPHLTHSGAVVSTGPSGTRNQAYAAMQPADSFEIAAQTAKDLLKEVGAQWS